MSKREQRIYRAAQLIKDNPEWGRDRINKALQREFGTGLRKKYVDQIKRDILNRPRRGEEPRPQVFKDPEIVVKRYRPHVAPRFEALMKRGFLDWEAVVLVDIPTYVPYRQQLIQERWNGYREARRQGLSWDGWAAVIRKVYADNGWFDAVGNFSPWAYLRAFEDKYRADHPDYETPEKKRKTPRKEAGVHSTKLDEGRAEKKYPRGYGTR